jgi:hypothetical protein
VAEALEVLAAAHITERQELLRRLAHLRLPLAVAVERRIQTQLCLAVLAAVAHGLLLAALALLAKDMLAVMAQTRVLPMAVAVAAGPLQSG